MVCHRPTFEKEPSEGITSSGRRPSTQNSLSYIGWKPSISGWSPSGARDEGSRVRAGDEKLSPVPEIQDGILMGFTHSELSRRHIRSENHTLVGRYLLWKLLPWGGISISRVSQLVWKSAPTFTCPRILIAMVDRSHVQISLPWRKCSLPWWLV